MSEIQGIVKRVEDRKLILEIDLDADYGPTSTGKTHIVGSTGGFCKLDEIEPGLSMNVGIYRKVKR